MFERLHPRAATAFGVPAYARIGRDARKAMSIRLSNGLLMPGCLALSLSRRTGKAKPHAVFARDGQACGAHSGRSGSVVEPPGGTTPRGGRRRRLAQRGPQHGRRRSPRLLEIRSTSAGGQADSWRVPMRALQEFPAPVLAPIKGGVGHAVRLGSRKDGDGHRAQREQHIDAHQLAYGIQGCRRHWPGGRVAMRS